MRGYIAIKCKNCDYLIKCDRKKLAANYWGKTVHITCPKCKNMNPFKVDADSMSGKQIRRDTENYTKVIDKNIIEKKQVINKILRCKVIGDQNNNEQILILNEGVNILGRAVPGDEGIENKVRIDTHENKISRKHCQITVSKSNDGTYSYIIEDLGSKNKTHLYNGNDSRALIKGEKIYVKEGSVIGLGYRTKIILI